MSYSKTIDGTPFEGYGARFTGTTPVDLSEVSSVGDIDVWIVVGRCSAVAAKTDKDGSLMRVNVLTVGDARLVPDDLKDILVEKLGLDIGQSIPVSASNPRSDKTDYAVDRQTGELT